MDDILGPLSALASSFTWAVGVTTYSQLAHRYPAAAVNVTRAVVALPLAIVFGWLSLGGVVSLAAELSQVSLTRILWLTVAMFSGYAFGDVLFLLSTRAIGAPVALAIASCYPFWSALAGLLFLGEPVSLHKGLGIIFTVSGTVVVILAGRPQVSNRDQAVARTYYKGITLALLTSGFWALNAYSTTVGGRGLPVAIATILRLGIALALCPLVALVMERRLVGPVSRADLRRFLPVFMLEGFGGATLYMYGLGHSSIAAGAALSALSPAIAAPMAWFTRTEAFSALKTLGIIVALAGVILLIIH